jgi:hypothetical protein
MYWLSVNSHDKERRVHNTPLPEAPERALNEKHAMNAPDLGGMARFSFGLGKFSGFLAALTVTLN